MKPAIGAICLILFISILSFGFALPDFSGDWIRDVERGDPLSTLSDGLIVRQTEASLDVESVWNQNPTTQVSQNEQLREIKTPFGSVFRRNTKEERKLTYLLDGNDHSVTDQNGNLRTYRVTQSGDQLVIERSNKTNTPFGPAETKVKEEWSISADGGILTITTSTYSSFRTVTQTQVYTKRP